MNTSEYLRADQMQGQTQTLSIQGVAPSAAVCAARVTREIISEFCAVVSLEDNVKQGRSMSPSAVMWWFTQNEEARKSLFIEPHNVRDALTKFRLRHNEHQPSRVWANSPSFDLVIIEDAMRSLGFHVPWHFSARRDVRTIKELAVDEDGSFPDFTGGKGTAHNALADSINQAMQVQYC